MARHDARYNFLLMSAQKTYNNNRLKKKIVILHAFPKIHRDIDHPSYEGCEIDTVWILVFVALVVFVFQILYPCNQMAPSIVEETLYMFCNINFSNEVMQSHNVGDVAIVPY